MLYCPIKDPLSCHGGPFFHHSLCPLPVTVVSSGYFIFSTQWSTVPPQCLLSHHKTPVFNNSVPCDNMVSHCPIRILLCSITVWLFVLQQWFSHLPHCLNVSKLWYAVSSKYSASHHNVPVLHRNYSPYHSNVLCPVTMPHYIILYSVPIPTTVV